MATAETTTELPSASSPLFLSLVACAGVLPYALVLAVYAYHFVCRRSAPLMRNPEKDAPKPEHVHDWRTAVVRPEGISAVVLYMMLSLALALLVGLDPVPGCIKDLTLSVRLLPLGAYFLVFDALMYIIHTAQHQWRWLYYATHYHHHTITSPTIIVALTGYAPDTMLLILLPLHLTLFLVPGGNFLTVFVFSAVALVHLHMIHSEFQHPWDGVLRRLGLVNTWDHHVHHVMPVKNLAHFFTILDKLGGTYVDPLTLPRLKCTT